VGKRVEGLVDRRLLGVALARLQDEPVLALQGPRTVGKSTLLRALALVLSGVVVDLDDLATREAVAADPAAFLSGRDMVCIDEYQHVPEILDAVKAELNRDLRPGRFVLTGSTRHDALPAVARALTGRLHLVTVLPLSQVELAGRAGNALGELLRGEPLAGGAASLTTREEYVDRVVVGGLPLALARHDAARLRWFDDYVRLSLERGSAEVTRVRQPAQLQGLLERLAGQTAQVLNVAAAARAVGMDERTADHYISLLEAVFLVQRLPAWGTTLRARAGSSPKIHVTDSGVAARLLRLTPARLVRAQAAARAEFGHLFETFVVGELLKQASWLDGVAGWGHWRTHDGDEVDLVVEGDDGGVVAFEVKAASRVSTEEFRGLRKLRSALGDRLICGVVITTGAHCYAAEDRVQVAPADRLWT
jgi:hypothetical protein